MILLDEGFYVIIIILIPVFDAERCRFVKIVRSLSNHMYPIAKRDLYRVRAKKGGLRNAQASKYSSDPLASRTYLPNSL